MRIIFVNRFFYPDHSATSQILSDLAFHLSVRGERVEVIASRQRYDRSRERELAAREIVHGVVIHRVETTDFGRHWLPGRMLDYLSFYVAAGIKLIRLARRGDVVIAKTDPPMLSVLTRALSFLRGYKTINWLQDLYPEIAISLGVSGLKGVLGKTLAGLRNNSLRRAVVNVAIGDDMAQHLQSMGLPGAKLCVIPNWTDDETIVPIEGHANALRSEWELDGRFVVAYSGNLGRAHDSDTILGAAEILASRPEIVFLLVGGGRGIDRLEAEAGRRGLKNFMFKPYQRRSFLPQSLSVGDVHWLSLNAEVDGLLLPSKFYGIAAAGRPIIVIGSLNGELSRLVHDFHCGFHVLPGHSDELARLIASLAEDASRCRQLGANARLMLEARFSKAQALARWHDLLIAAVGKEPITIAR